MRSKVVPTPNVFLRDFWTLFLIFAHFGADFLSSLRWYAFHPLNPGYYIPDRPGPPPTPDTSSIFRRVPLGSAPAVRIHAKKKCAFCDPQMAAIW